MFRYVWQTMPEFYTSGDITIYRVYLIAVIAVFSAVCTWERGEETLNITIPFLSLVRVPVNQKNISRRMPNWNTSYQTIRREVLLPFLVRETQQAVRFATKSNKRTELSKTYAKL